MRFGILGPTEVLTATGDPLPVGGPRVRALLTLLLLDAGRVVSAERLLDGLYGERPPSNPVNALQSQVSRLRQAGISVELLPAGYRLDAAQVEALDAHRFEQLADHGRRALAAGDHAGAAARLGDALALWRGPALADAPFAAAAAARLEELRLAALEDRIDADLGTGAHQALVAELGALIAAHPLRERLRGQLVRALHAGGRRAEALAAFEDARRTLAEELGADPSPELAAIHLAVLRAENPPEPRKNTLPAALTSFVGRSVELRQVGTLLGDGRLVTLTGPGGAGKTRLAIEAARAWPAETCLVELAPIDADVAQAVLSALGLREGTFPADRPATPPADRLAAALATRNLLLVLDNCEHVVDEAAELTARLLAACPALRVLATSREPLAITGETTLAVTPLPVAPPGVPPADAVTYPAVRLFAERAAAVRPGFTVDDRTVGDVQRVCAALDGLPLAVELAAARVRSLPLGEIAVRLDDRFTLLSRGDRTAAPRHRTLRAVVEWSWDLLEPEEQTLARRLAVFAGGATADAVAAVCGAGEIGELAEKSLVDLGPDGRYRMLETIKAFGAEKLAEAGETEQLRRAHAEHFLAFAETAEPHLRSADQLDWLAALDADYENLLAALRWATDTDPALALRLVAPLCTYWWMRGRRSEGSMLSQDVALRVGPEPPPGLHDEFVLCVGNAAIGTPAHEQLAPHLEAVRRFARDWREPPRYPMVAMVVGLVAGPPDPGTPADRLGPEGFAGDPWSQGLALMGTGLKRMLQGDNTEAERLLSAAVDAYRALGERWGLSLALSHYALLLGRRGDLPASVSLSDEALALTELIGATDDTTELLYQRADRRRVHGDLTGAEADYERAIALARRAGTPDALSSAYHGLADIARLRGQFALARELLARSRAECPVAGFTQEMIHAQLLVTEGRIDEATGAVEAAELRYREALAAPVSARDHTAAADAVDGLAGIALRHGDPERAAFLLGAAVALRGVAVAGDADVARVSAAVREHLGDETFDRAYARGQSLSPPLALDAAGA
ncbi:BTAD domain-containing putative transcriptional regulator [Amycolatopsis sp. 195334CR]|uniref:BTAD domain-containing putative transcriptional regulator n=1 Tax=Amycolatopsis sp. 195334CR TaxID=2814588 RepID=UPI001A8C8D68|nr:BTAD domain-containing putative transcriptional regulator [Amycolatopsis sp. 195334CR]MBN6035382.1 winged helix-turn-helix domain-containing protein [Amycolatopsis sp. 195334CR]